MENNMSLKELEKLVQKALDSIEKDENDFDKSEKSEKSEESSEKSPEKLIDLLKNDSRKGAKKLADKLEKNIIKVKAEREKIQEMFEFQRLIVSGTGAIAGVDEAGRGPLAGPVVAAAVVLDETKPFKLVDSKSIDEKEREKICLEIKEKAVDYGIGIVNVKVIDRINILNANKLAIIKAVKNLNITPDHILIDGNDIPGELKDKAEAVIKGDSKAAAIAGAGILAKVTRDRIMYRLDKSFPRYGFGANKGYGTKEHREAVERYGLTPVHRRSFSKDLV